MKWISMALAWSGISLAACQTHKDVPCEQDSNCDLSAGGVCATASTGGQWCAYPASDCPSGLRFSNDDVGDGIGGTCLDRATNTLTRTLTVVLRGNGVGHIVSDPAGIDCPGACSASFSDGQAVTLSHDTTSSIFQGWTDDCTANTDCHITLDADRRVGGRFGIPGSNAWLSQLGASAYGKITDAKVMSNHDIVVAGDFQTTMSFGGVSLIAPGTGSAGFVARLRATDGSLVWIKTIGSTSDVQTRYLGVDPADDVFLSGRFRGTITLDGATAASAGDTDTFILKMSGEDGTAGWHRTFGTPSTDYVYGMAVDRVGNVSLTGYFDGTISPGGQALQGGWATYIVKYANATGIAIWSKAITGSNTFLGEYPTSLAVDNAGNLIISGNFSGTVDFGGGPRTAQTGNLNYLAKYASDNGAYIFDTILGLPFPKSVNVDAAGSIYVLGYFTGSQSISGLSATSVGGQDIFLLKYSSAGAPQWIQRLGNERDDSPSSLIVDDQGELLLTTTFQGTVTYGGPNLASAGDTDAAVVRLRASNGSYLSSFRIGGPGYDEAYAVTGSSTGIFVAGLFSQSADFGGQSLSAAGTSDGFALMTLPLTAE